MSSREAVNNVFSKHPEVAANSPSHLCHLCFQHDYISHVALKALAFFFFCVFFSSLKFHLAFRSVRYGNALLFPPTTIIKIPPCTGTLPSGSFLDNMQRCVGLSHQETWTGTHTSAEGAMDGGTEGGGTHGTTVRADRRTDRQTAEGSEEVTTIQGETQASSDAKGLRKRRLKIDFKGVKMMLKVWIFIRAQPARQLFPLMNQQQEVWLRSAQFCSRLLL